MLTRPENRRELSTFIAQTIKKFTSGKVTSLLGARISNKLVVWQVYIGIRRILKSIKFGLPVLGVVYMEVESALRRLAAFQPDQLLQRSSKAFYHELIKTVASLCRTELNSLYFAAQDGQQLVLQAAVGLPDDWLSKVRNIPVHTGPLAGICGRAAALKQVVLAPNMDDEIWNEYREAALSVGIQAAWSMPLIGSHGELIGTFATYYRHPYAPSYQEIQQIQRVVHEAVRIIEMSSPYYDLLQSTDSEGDQRSPYYGASYYGLLQGLLISLETRHFETVAHSRRVVTYTLLLADQLHIDEQDMEQIAFGAALHDVGKIGISDAILLKPDKLTPQEYEIVKQHPVIGYRMLKDALSGFPEALAMIRHHHERYDGYGYPDGLEAKRIPLGARMLAVADTLDVMTSERPYQRRHTFQQAIVEIESLRGQQFCPNCVDALLALDTQVFEAVHRGELDRTSIMGPLFAGLGKGLATSNHTAWPVF